MTVSLKRTVLRFLRVSERPTPPPGAGDSFELSNPSKKLLMLSWFKWAWGQFWALVGVVFSLAFLGALDLPKFFERFGFVMSKIQDEFELEEPISLDILGVLIDTEINLLDLFSWFEVFAVSLFLVQFVVSAFLVKLRWEMHWYMVSDRILGIRKGLMKVNEQTMTIANVQNMKINQGPVQRLLGISDLVVQTAGGGGAAQGDSSHKGGGALHIGRFEGLDDAEAFRETIRRTLARTRTSGLGDPDDLHVMAGAPPAETDSGVSVPVAVSSASRGGLKSEARAFKEEASRARQAAESLLQEII